VSASTLLDRATPIPTLNVIDGAASNEVHPDQLTLPFIWEVSEGIPSVPPLPRHLRLVGSDPNTADQQGAGATTSGVGSQRAFTGIGRVAADGRPTSMQPAQEALTPAWVARMARAIIEVADGDRPASQLTRWVERAPLAMLNARGIAYRRHPAVRNRRGELSAVRATQQVRAVRLCPVSPQAVEASAVLIGGGRGRAVALRFEARGSNWIVAAIALG